MRESIARITATSRGLINRQTARIVLISLFRMRTSGHRMAVMKAGGGMTHYPNSTMKAPRNCMTIFWRLGKNGYRRRITPMGGAWMWRRIWDTVRNAIISFGRISAKQSRKRIRMLLFWQNITAMPPPGWEVISGIRS